jgi:hypothetical protein
MWFNGSTTNDFYCDILICTNKSLEGFNRCLQCLPSRQALFENYKKWNREYENDYDSYYKYEKNEDYFNTNCVLTCNTIIDKFGFYNFPNLRRFETMNKFFNEQKKTQICAVELCYNGFLEHIFLMISNFIVHSFHGEYELKITKIDQRWINNFKLKKWNKICETRYIPKKCQPIFWFP